jgi:hypothetical protein
VSSRCGFCASQELTREFVNVSKEINTLSGESINRLCVFRSSFTAASVLCLLDADRVRGRSFGAELRPLIQDTKAAMDALLDKARRCDRLCHLCSFSSHWRLFSATVSALLTRCR